jgi:1,4-alpha-glucan branching enzyme
MGGFALRMVMRWTAFREGAKVKGIIVYLKAYKIFAALLLMGWSVAMPAGAQSSRPGWGSTPYNGGVTFRVWAPDATSVYVPGQFNNWSTSATSLTKELTNGAWVGTWSADVAGALTNQQYKYYINYSGASVWKHDPRSRLVTEAGSADGANDIIYSTTDFNWNGDSVNPPALNDLFVYELHMGTFPASSTPSRFVAATNHLDYLKNLGVNAVEVMPIAEFPPGGSSWGYNPAQMFAAENAQYGGPDGFKTFVQACHLRGIAVLLDTVHNHYGPTDLDIWNFDGWAGSGPIGGGIYFWESNTNLEITPWGNTRPNFSSNQVCSFIQDNITMWLSECHVDGFRWDSVYTILHGNDGSYISDAGTLMDNINDMIHTNYTGKISIAEDVYEAFGFDSAWDTAYPGDFTPVLANTVDADRDMSTIANAVQDNVSYGGTASQARVAYLESHDVVGDLNGGVRLVTAIDPTTPNSYRARKLSTLGSAVTLTAPGVPMIFQGQEMLENAPFDSGTNVDWSKTNTYSYIVQFYHDLISPRRDLKGYTPGLEGDQCNVFQVDNANKVVAFNRWKSAAPNQDAVMIANFTETILSNYSVSFPTNGAWYVHLNSDSTKYGPDYGNVGSSVVTASGSPAKALITLGPYSALILSQTPDASPQLTITPTAGGVNVSWPGSYFEWGLSQSASPGQGSAWTEISPAQYQTNGSTVSVNVTPANGNSFYRLQKL